MVFSVLACLCNKTLQLTKLSRPKNCYLLTVVAQKKYATAAARVAACRARKNKKAATFDLSPDILDRLEEFMRLRVDSKNPDETKSQVVERALNNFFRKR